MVGPNSGPGSVMGGMPSPGGESGMDEDSMMQAMAGSSSSGDDSSGSSQSQADPADLSSKVDAAQAKAAQDEANARPVGTVGEETKRGAGDIASELKKFFSVNTWLGIDPEKMSPEEEAKAQEFHARYQQLDQEQQAVAKQMFQERQQQKQMQEEEERQKKEMEAQEKEQSVSMPSSPQKGAVGPGGSKKQQATQKLKQDRTTLNTMQGE